MSKGAVPEVPQRAPYILKMKPGKYWWCACGKSVKQPFCDGSHHGGEIKPLQTEIADEKEVAWCGCKQTGSPPFCDGSHK